MQKTVRCLLLFLAAALVWPAGALTRMTVPPEPIGNALPVVAWSDGEWMRVALANEGTIARRLTVKLGRVRLGRQVVATQRQVEVPAGAVVVAEVTGKASSSYLKKYGLPDRVFVTEGRELVAESVIQGDTASGVRYQVDSFIVPAGKEVRWTVSPALLAPQAKRISFGVRKDWRLEGATGTPGSSGPVELVQPQPTAGLQTPTSLAESYLMLEVTPKVAVRAVAPDVKTAGVISFGIGYQWEEENGVQSGTAVGPSILVYNPEKLRVVSLPAR